MFSFLWGIFVIIALLYLSLLYESVAMALLGFSEAVFLVLSFIYLHIGRRHLGVRLEMPITIAQKDQEFHIRITVQHKTKPGYSKMKVMVEYKNSMERSPSRTRLTIKHIPAGESAYQFGLRITEPGNYEFNVKKVRVYDLLGLFYVEKKLEGGDHAMVLPLVREIPVHMGERVYHYFADSDLYDELRPGYDPAEVYGVREFRPGDKLPKVHWKLSAKTDEWMVRENGFPKGCPVVVFLNSNEGDTGGMLELAASLSFSMMDAGCHHYAVWQSRSGGDLIRTRVDDEESYYLFITTFLRDRSPERIRDMKARYYDKYRGEKALYHILLENGRMYLDGERMDTAGEIELTLR